jgi:AraC-like DNA-binding protein
MQLFLRMSSRSRPKTKRKRPDPPYQTVYAPVKLPENFPVVGHSLFAQGDAPITFLHRHDCLELGYCYEGAGVFVIGEKVLPFQAGDVSLITPAECHLARSVEGTQSKWAWLYLDPLRLLQALPHEFDFLRTVRLSGKSFGNMISPRADSLVGLLVRQIVDELRDRSPGYQMAIKGLVWTLMVRFNRLAPRRKLPATDDTSRNLHRVAPALDLMAANYSTHLSAVELARSCRTSVTHHRRLFREALGKSPHRYLTELRVRMAATQLKATNEKIVVVAGQVGFATLSSFNRAFRKLMKSTPRQWRNQS